jgi:hypothetical protein
LYFFPSTIFLSKNLLGQSCSKKRKSADQKTTFISGKYTNLLM